MHESIRKKKKKNRGKHDDDSALIPLKRDMDVWIVVILLNEYNVTLRTIKFLGKYTWLNNPEVYTKKHITQV